MCGVPPPPAGLIPVSLELNRQAVLQWTADELRVIIDGDASALTDGTLVPAIARVASVSDEWSMLAKQLVYGVVDYDLLVRLTGGRKPVDGDDDWCAGSWGVSSDDAAGTWKQCVPIAMAHAGRITGTLYGEGLGCELGPHRDFGLGPLAARCVQGGLSAANTRLLFIDIFQKLAWGMDSRRTGPGRPLPNIPAFVAQAERAKVRALRWANTDAHPSP